MFLLMARMRMTYWTCSRLKLSLVSFFLFFTLIIIVRTSWWPSLDFTDIDHGPNRSGYFVPVRVTVFYEALCPDSKNFILRQVRPTIEKAPGLVNFEFVPYGKAKTEIQATSINFSCQHGPVECYANKIHACSLSRIPDQKTKVEYVSCMITDNYEPDRIGNVCAAKFGIDWEPILACSKSSEGNLLLEQMGKLTHDLHPAPSFIPTVLLDGDRSNQPRILKDLLKQVCSHFRESPEECKELVS